MLLIVNLTQQWCYKWDSKYKDISSSRKSSLNTIKSPVVIKYDKFGKVPVFKNQKDNITRFLQV